MEKLLAALLILTSLAFAGIRYHFRYKALSGRDVLIVCTDDSRIHVTVHEEGSGSVNVWCAER
jgi:hypothetical protein